MMEKKIFAICITALFLLTSISTISAMESNKHKSLTEKEKTLIEYDLTFETYPGRCRCLVVGRDFFIRWDLSSYGDYGTCIFRNIKKGTYLWLVYKSGYNPDFGLFDLEGNSKIIAVLDPK